MLAGLHKPREEKKTTLCRKRTDSGADVLIIHGIFIGGFNTI
jgi:hypothetical protein